MIDMDNSGVQEKLRKVMRRTISNWDTEDIHKLWERTKIELTEKSDEIKCNGIIDACWDELISRGEIEIKG